MTAAVMEPTVDAEDDMLGFDGRPKCSGVAARAKFAAESVPMFQRHGQAQAGCGSLLIRVPVAGYMRKPDPALLCPTCDGPGEYLKVPE